MPIEWKPIDPNLPPRTEALLYFPAVPPPRPGHHGLSAMYRVGLCGEFPNRQPTHWAPLRPPEA